ncbi:hypothetical protein AVEN_255968-1 [Araneus ventricosus]|uniref:Uncharacterized protein n=1 Tax=Araneus ventricosus TaxID=182803 RepID=A0A4Y2MG31_ARAVE|nr:hypothetical protein AVEN_255968-1 [Araneus ventricosus]
MYNTQPITFGYRKTSYDVPGQQRMVMKRRHVTFPVNNEEAVKAANMFLLYTTKHKANYRSVLHSAQSRARGRLPTCFFFIPRSTKQIIDLFYILHKAGQEEDFQHVSSLYYEAQSKL